MEPKDVVSTTNFKGFSNKSCEFFPCHKRHTEFNCLFCYCPLAFLNCPGPYKVFTDKNGLKRKDCSSCTLPHHGFNNSWNFIQKWLAKPIPWDGNPQKRNWKALYEKEK
jgi:Zn-finger protein